MTDAVTLGIDVGGTKILGLAIDGSGAVLAEAKVATPRLPPPPHRAAPGGDAVVEAIAVVAEQLLAALGAGVEPAPAVGVGVPGLVDDAGVLRFAPNLPGGEGLDVAGRVSRRLQGLPVVVDNDATCAVIGEWVYGAAAGATDAVVVTLGTGIGGGLIVNNRVARGALGYAGEIGHMVVDPSGPSLPLRQAGVLGALRLGQRPRASGPGGGPCRAARRGPGPGRRRSRSGAGRGRHRRGGRR